MSGKLSDGLDQSNEISPEQVPIKSIVLTPMERESFASRADLTDDEYAELCYNRDEKSNPWPTATDETPLTVELALLKLAQHVGADHPKVEESIRHLVYHIIPRYKPDLYAARRYMKQPDFQNIDALSLFVYTIELYDVARLEKTVKKLEPEEFHHVLEKLLKQKDLDIYEKLKAEYHVTEGTSVRLTLHKLWPEIAHRAKRKGIEDVEANVDQLVKELVTARISREGMTDFMEAVRNTQLSIDSFLTSTEWQSVALRKLKLKDRDRVESIHEYLLSLSERDGTINLGDFGIGGSVPKQIYGELNRNLRELDALSIEESRMQRVLLREGVRGVKADTMQKLIERRKRFDEGFQPWKEMYFLIERALQRLPTSTSHDTVYRGINVELPERVFKPGKYFAWPAFSSTSCDRKQAQKFSGGGAKGTLFVVLGQLTGRDVHLFSRFPEEEEVLLPPQSYFKVVYRTSEIENIMGKTGPIITVSQLDLHDVDKGIESHAIARMVWIMNFQGAMSAPFDVFENVHLNTLASSRDAMFIAIGKLWAHLKENSSNSDLHLSAYKKILQFFGANKTRQVTLEAFITVARGLTLTESQRTYLSSGSNGPTPVTVGGVAYTMQYDYSDYLLATLRYIKRELDVTRDPKTLRSHAGLLVEAYAGVTYFHLKTVGPHAKFGLRGLPLVQSVAFTIGCQLMVQAEDGEWYFLAPRDCDDVQNVREKFTEFQLVHSSQACLHRRLLRRTAMWCDNAFGVYLDDEESFFAVSEQVGGKGMLVLGLGAECEGAILQVALLPESQINTHDNASNESALLQTFTSKQINTEYERTFLPMAFKVSPQHSLKMLHQRVLRVFHREASSRTVVEKLECPIPYESPSFGRRVIEEMFPFVDRRISLQTLLLQSKLNADVPLGLSRTPREEALMSNYIPFPFMFSLSVWWSQPYFAVAAFVLQIVIVALFEEFYFFQIHPVIQLSLIIGTVLAVVYVCVVYLHKKSILSEIARSAPYATDSGAISTAVRLIMIPSIAIMFWMATQFFSPGWVWGLAPPDGYKTPDNRFYMQYILFATTGLSCVSCAGLFMVSNQLVYDRLQTFVDLLLTMNPTDFSQNRMIQEYMETFMCVSDMKTAWRTPLSVAFWFTIIASVLSIVTLCISWSTQYMYYEVVLEATIPSFFGISVFLTMSTIMRWNGVHTTVLHALGKRYHELQENSIISHNDFVRYTNVFSRYPIHWNIPTGLGEHRATLPTLLFFLGLSFVGTLGRIVYDTTLMNNNLCTTTMGFEHNRVQTVYLGQPKFGDTPFNLSTNFPQYPPAREESFLHVDDEPMQGFKLSFSANNPAKWKRGKYRTTACKITGCFGFQRRDRLFPMDGRDVCSEMFSLVNMSYQEPFTYYGVRVNTDNAVWKKTESWAMLHWIIVLKLDCLWELGQGEQRVCMFTNAPFKHRVDSYEDEKY
eukprot:PhF_6_TR11599/c1_g3_i1/m.18785